MKLPRVVDVGPTDDDVEEGQAAVRANAARAEQAARGGGAVEEQAQEAGGQVRLHPQHGFQEEEAEEKE